MNMQKRSDWESWGRVFKYNHYILNLDPNIDYSKSKETIFSLLSSSSDPKYCLPYGYGRSYGDSCLSKDSLLLSTSNYSNLISFNEEEGIIRAQAGISLDNILRIIIPKGWFLPVTPGTKYVSLGGAIANDVHGKNHHKQGTFGSHILKFLLLRSDGVFECSPTENQELFNATISGLGLTGLILWADLKLTKIKSHLIDSTTIKIHSLDDFLKFSEKYDKDFESSVSWIDCLAKGKNLGRGLFMLGNHAKEHTKEYNPKGGNPILTIPFNFPNFTLNSLSIKMFNFLYYHKQIPEVSNKKVHFDSFYYPLDILSKWNRIYGNRGFYQYQFVIPEDKIDTLVKILEKIAASNMASFLAVLKKFGTISSPGLLSFPSPGYTLALDFPNYGKKLLDLFRSLDDMVLEANGKLYPAKDACMSSTMFKTMYPKFQEFEKYIDPKFRSSFCERVK